MCTSSAPATTSCWAARVAHDRGLSGHSDADVVLHALVDAILGALADGDIGVHFRPAIRNGAVLLRPVPRLRDRPPARSRRAYRSSRRHRGLRGAAHRLHRDAIRARIAEIAGVPIERVGVKATTSEKMGFTGRRKAWRRLANVTVRLPWSD